MKAGTLFLFLVLLASSVMAAPFPADWQAWSKVQTPLAQIGALPGCDANVSSLPQIYQDTVAAYCNVKPGGPGKVEILVKPASVAAYKTKTGKFGDGPQMALHLIDLKALMVTFYEGGKANYAVFTEDGKEITAPQGPLSAKFCQECHSGYQAFCVNGQCASAK